jgi:hypothetical protein
MRRRIFTKNSFVSRMPISNGMLFFEQQIAVVTCQEGIKCFNSLAHEIVCFSIVAHREDILDDTKDETRTDRFVKWINRRNVRRQQAKRDVRSTTHRVLNSSKPEGDSSRYGRRTVTSLDSYDGFTFLDPLTNQPSMQWECLSDGGDMELCAMSGSVLEGEDSIVTLGSLRRMLSDEELMQARSMPTLAETLSHATGSEDNMESPYDEAQSRVVT